MANKINWEKVRMENAIQKQGSFTLKGGRKSQPVVLVRCRRCGETITELTSREHWATCKERQGRLKTGTRRRRTRPERQAKPISHYARLRGFPTCMLDKWVRTGGFTGIAKEIRDAGTTVRLESKGGISKNCKISAAFANIRRAGKKLAPQEDQNDKPRGK